MREVSAGRGGLLTSRTRPNSTANDGMTVHLEMGKPPYAFEERKQSGFSVEDDGRKGVIGKCCASSLYSLNTWT